MNTTVQRVLIVKSSHNVDILNFELFNFVYGAPKQPSLEVRGYLKESIAFWEQNKACTWVLRVIREGYALPFVETPEKKAAFVLECAEITWCKRCYQ